MTAQSRYYLSGPMSGLPEFNYPAFASAAADLRSVGCDVLSAHEIDHGGPAGSLPWGAYLRNDLREMVTCDALILLEGWPSSKGARLELAVALGLEMPVYFYREDVGLISMQRGL